MKRLVAIGALCLMLGACNVVVTKTPLLTKADETGAPPLKPGLWRFSGDQDCKVDEAKPLVDWPSCGGGVVIKDGAAGYYDRQSESPVWTDQPFVFAAGNPRILQAQAKISGDVKVTADPFVYAGARLTKSDSDGRITAVSLWPVQCGPPPPGDKAESTTKPLPGIEMKPGDPVCTTTSIPALRAAAQASEAWAPKPVIGRWLRDGGP
jgi:hypothetical protein